MNDESAKKLAQAINLMSMSFAPSKIKEQGFSVSGEEDKMEMLAITGLPDLYTRAKKIVCRY